MSDSDYTDTIDWTEYWEGADEGAVRRERRGNGFLWHDIGGGR